MQLFQRRRWINPGRVDAGLDAFVRQLAWIDANTALAMAGWRRDDSGSGPGISWPARSTTTSLGF